MEDSTDWVASPSAMVMFIGVISKTEERVAVAC
jgi:hypothetical protein